MKRTTLLRSIADDNGASDTTESKRKQVSKRAFLERGEECDKIEDCDGAQYLLLDPAGNHTFKYEFGKNPMWDKMFAAFGFHTKIGNVANTVLNDKDEPGTASDAADAIKEFLAGTVWAERAVGAGGTRIDKDALAAAIVEWAAGQGATKDLADVREKLEDNPALVRKFRANPDVRALYDKRVGKAPASPAALLGAI